MAKLKIFTVKDNTAKAFLQPVYCANKGTFIRMLQETLKSNESNLSKYPEEFSAYELGEYDETTGIIDSYQDIKFVMKIADLITNDEK